MNDVHAMEVKVVLASVATALAVYQLVLAAIGYANLGPPMSEAEQELREERLEQQEDRREDRD